MFFNRMCQLTFVKTNVNILYNTRNKFVTFKLSCNITFCGITCLKNIRESKEQIMKRKVTKLISLFCASAAMAALASNLANAGAISDFMPAAGIARALNEGKSVTAIRADKVRATGQIDAIYIEDVEKEAIEITEAATERAVEAALMEEEERATAESSEAAVVVAESDESSSVRREVTDAADISAGAGDESIIRGESQKEDKKGTVSTGDIGNISAGAGSNSKKEEEQNDGSMNLVDAANWNVEKEEDFSNLVIARVTDYVNVRTEPSEESEVAGKLYNKSVGDMLEDAGEWIKIKSGNTVGYVKGEYVVRGEEAKQLAKIVGTRTAKVITTTLYVRDAASTDGDVIGMVPMDDELTVLDESTEGWAKVSVEEGEGYVNTSYVRLYTDFVRAESKQEEEARLAREEREREAARAAAEAAARKQREEEEREKAKKNAKDKNSKDKNSKDKNSSSSKGNSSKNSGKGGSSSGSSGSSYSGGGSGTGGAVASYALKFVGNPYVYGGTSLTNGADCSGFVMSVYRNFGVSLPHSSGADRSVGSAVQGGLANAKAGDIVCYSGHVGIYIGGGQIVHASTAKTGIKVSSANYRTPVAVRRIF